MKFSVIPSDKFKKEAKRLVKKFPSLKQELLQVNIALSNQPETGTPLGNNTYKIRLAIKSKGKGKSVVQE
jgi:mRNA-degrading endonuclease RelE of RelBE toxin-antitoxin system